MIDWLLKSIGVKEDLVSHLREASVTFHHPLVLWVGVPLLLLVGVFVFWRQWWNLRSSSPYLRVALSLTRVFILAMLLAVLAGPLLKLDLEDKKKPIVALLFDQSQSMQLPAGPFETDEEMGRIAQAAGYQAPEGKPDPEARKALDRISRAKLSLDVVQASNKTFLGPLSSKYDVRFYSFSRDAIRLGADPGHPEFPEPPNPGGTSTHLGDAVTHVLEEAGGRQIAGIFVFSDGENTGGRSPSEAAHAASAAGAPIFSVPAGSSTRLKDVAIVDVFTSGLVSVGDTVRVNATVESQGFDKRPVKVELRDGEKLLDSKDLVLLSTEQQQVELTFQATEPGAHYLTVTVPPLPEEPEFLRSNNSDVAFVRISDEKLKVLVIDGLPRWDFRFLKNAIRRDHGLAGKTAKEPDLVLEAEWRRLPSDQQAAALPRTLKELAEYHTVILGDVSPGLLSPSFIELLDQAVREKGMGLIVEAGPQHMPHDFDERFQALLPVKLKSKAAGRPADIYAFRLELSPDGAIHDAMRFYDDPGRNQNAWSHMPPYYWCAAAERPSPGATVLVWNPSIEGPYGKLPLIASHYAGQGRVMFVGTDSTWLWRQNVGDRFFYKFWGQSIRFVARRNQADSKKSWIEVRPIRAQPGEPAQIELMAFGADGAPRTDPTLPVQVMGQGTANSLELTADPMTKGRYTGRFTPPAPGEYRVSFNPGVGAEPVEARIRVLDTTEELRHPNVDRPALELLARNSGGQLVELPDLGTIPEKLKGDTKSSRLAREANLWDNWLTLAILMFVFSLDVGLRRLAGLS